MRKVVVCGGGIMGTSSAYWIKLKDPKIDVTVLEQDPTFRTASTPLAVGGIRFQFSIRENIEMSKFGAQFLQQAQENLGIEGQPEIDLNYHLRGYTFLLKKSTVYGSYHQLVENVALQKQCGCAVKVCSVEETRKVFPFLHVDDITSSTISEEVCGEGWFDPALFHQSLRKKAIHLGVKYQKRTVTGYETEENRITGVRVATGSSETVDVEGRASVGGTELLPCDDVILALGRHSGTHAKKLGVEKYIQVAPRKRYVHLVSCPNFEVHRSEAYLKGFVKKHRAFPLLVDCSGFYVRPEGTNFIVGDSPHSESEDPDVDAYDLNVGEDAESNWMSIWERLVHRIPSFSDAKLLSTWAGLYEYNKIDQNALIGTIAGAQKNAIWITGFSGHGLQQSPAAGRAVSELLLDGDFTSIDLKAMNPVRDPLYEKHVI